MMSGAGGGVGGGGGSLCGDGGDANFRRDLDELDPAVAGVVVDA